MLVGMKFRLRLRVLRKPKSRTQYDFQRGDEFRLKLANKYQLLAELGDSERTQEPREPDPEEMWNTLKVSILESAKKTFSVKRMQPKKPWVTPETLAMIEVSAAVLGSRNDTAIEEKSAQLAAQRQTDTPRRHM